MTRSPDRLEIPELPEARLDLRERLERLPPGHPSSPYEADGTRKPATATPNTDRHSADRQPDVGARDWPTQSESAESQSRGEPFTNAGWAEHISAVRDLLHEARDAGLATDNLHTTDTRREVWTKERRAIHTSIIDDIYGKAAGIPNEYRAIIAGGLPGAGKTTVLEHHAGIDRSQFLTINPDDIKAELARRGLIPEVSGLSPMEASDLVHEESSYIAKRLAVRAQADGKNLIWDITMSSTTSTQARIQDLRDCGYTDIEGVYVDLPPEVSVTRADGRHRDGEEKHRGGAGEGGRFIPAEGILANRDPTWGSLNRRTFETVKPALDAWSVYDNSVDGRAPVLVDAAMRKRGTHEQRGQ